MLDLSLPIVGGMASQNVLNLVDIAMVGTLGPVALAAVGLGSFANFMAMALVMGLSSGVQAMAARRKGEGRESEMAVALNGGLLLAIMIGLPILILLLWQAPVLFALLIDDPAVIAEGVPYFEARLYGVFAIGVNFAFRGYWNGISLSRIYLRVVLIMHISNVPISYVLIFGLFDWPGWAPSGPASAPRSRSISAAPATSGSGFAAPGPTASCAAFPTPTPWRRWCASRRRPRCRCSCSRPASRCCSGSSARSAPSRSRPPT